MRHDFRITEQSKAMFEAVLQSTSTGMDEDEAVFFSQLPSSARFGQLTLFRNPETTVNSYVVKNVAIAYFEFCIANGSFVEDFTTLRIDPDISLEDFYVILGEIKNFPKEDLAVFMTTKECATRTLKSAACRLVQYNFPKTEEKKRFYLKNFADPQTFEFMQEKLLPHSRRTMDALAF